MQQLGWGAPQAANGVGGAWQPCGMDGVETAQVDPQELSELAARALRVLLGAEHWLPLSCLRLAVLGSTHDSRRCAGSVLGLRQSPRRSNTQPLTAPPSPGRLSARPPSHPLPPFLPAPRSKCLLELAVATLCDQGLVLRQGYGPLAALSVSPAAALCCAPLQLPARHTCSLDLPARQPPLHPPGQPGTPHAGNCSSCPFQRVHAPCPTPRQVPDAALSKAEALAYSEFPDEGQLPLYSSSLAAAQHRGGGGLVAAAHHRPGSCLRIARRLSSPRQFSHRPMAGACGRHLGHSGGAYLGQGGWLHAAGAGWRGVKGQCCCMLYPHHLLLMPSQLHPTPTLTRFAAGIEKASVRRLGGKRSSGNNEDIVQQMQKKMRMQDGGSGAGPFGGGGLQAMSP